MAQVTILEVDGGKTVRGTYTELTIILEGGIEETALETFMALGTILGVDGGKTVRGTYTELAIILEGDIGVIDREIFMVPEIILVEDGEKIVLEIGMERGTILGKVGGKDRFICIKECRT
jgi:hypothetical protein